MEAYNADEYRLLREDLRDVRNCTTQYLEFSFKLLGAGLAAIGALSAVQWESAELRLGLLSGATLVAGGALGLVGMVLVYKAKSHNRYAGYLDAIATEVSVSGRPPGPLFLWEPCLTAWRTRPRDPWERVRRAHRSIAGGLLVAILFGDHWRTPSRAAWGYPPVLVGVLLYQLIALVFVWLLYNPAFGPGLIIAIVVIALLWLSVFENLGAVTFGPLTIKDCADRWKQIRAEILGSRGIRVEYDSSSGSPQRAPVEAGPPGPTQDRGAQASDRAAGGESAEA